MCVREGLYRSVREGVIYRRDVFLLFLLFSLEFQRSEGNRHCFLLLPALPFLPDKSFDHAREVPEGVRDRVSVFG